MKENRAFRSYSSSSQTQKKEDKHWMKFSENPNTSMQRCRGCLNPQIRINKIVNSVDYHPCPSRLASSIHPFIFPQTS